MSSPSRTYAGRQMLTFRLGDEIFGVDILQVQEIRGWSPVTRIPQTPPYVLGVLNLRGSVVPIIDLRRRFELPTAEFNAVTVIIVLSVSGPAGSREIGVVVDAVSEVIDVTESDLRLTPEIGNRAIASHISGLLTIGDSMVILLDVDRLIGQSSDQIHSCAA